MLLIRESRKNFKLYQITPDFIHRSRIWCWFWIWPPFWGRRSHTRAQGIFLNWGSNETSLIFWGILDFEICGFFLTLALENTLKRIQCNYKNYSILVRSNLKFVFEFTLKTIFLWKLTMRSGWFRTVAEIIQNAGNGESSLALSFDFGFCPENIYKCEVKLRENS